MNDVSVIIPTYNRAAFISEAIDSILNQTKPPQEVIVVNDGSTDETEQVLQRYGSKIIYLKQENAGKSSALNRALSIATSEFVWIFDDDDVAYPEALEQHLDLHRRTGTLGFTYGSLDRGETGPDGRIRRTKRPIPIPPTVFDTSLGYQRIHLLRYSWLLLAACVVRRSLYQKVGGFREDLFRSQDYDMVIRLSQAGEFKFTGAPTSIIREHDGLRGPAAHLHANADRDRVWANYDYIIGSSIFESTPLSRFVYSESTGFSAHSDLMREALLRRAWVMASKAHLEQVKLDLFAASAINPDNHRLSPSEYEICSSLPDSHIFMMKLLDTPGWLLSLVALRRSAVGSAILREFAKCLYRMSVDRGSNLSLSDRVWLYSQAAALILASTRTLSNFKEMLSGYGRG